MKLKKFTVLSTILSTALFVPVHYSYGDAAAAQAAAQAAKPSAVDQLLSSSFIQQAGIVDAGAIKQFYDDRGGQFYWQGFWGITSDADYFIKVIGESWQQGLNPETYHYSQLRYLHQQDGPLAQARFDALMTDAFIHYVRDMSGMRVHAADLGLDPEDWLQPYTPRQVVKLLSEGRNIRGLLRGLPPQSATYKALQNEFIRLADEPPEPYLKALPIRLNTQLQPGQRDNAVPAIRMRLGVGAQTRDPYLYDDRLSSAVMRFQAANSLPADGVAGPTTVKFLNRTNRDKMLQLVANLERLRWVDDKRPDRFVLVNIPSATLWAVSRQKVEFEMPVIVGKPIRPTQPFIASITGVRFNPDWTVPPTIKRQDIVPKLQQDPDYLADKGMALVKRGPDGAQETVDPKDVNWGKITDAELASLDMVQIPGAHNPLGKIRILMPNPYNIYLHDTNEPEFFDKTLRAQSSGCIRMKEPEKMAKFVMEGQDGWSDAKMKDILNRGRTDDERITAQIPVYILYYSAWSDPRGNIVYGNDIYDFDKKLIDKLSAIDGFQLGDHNDLSMAGSGRPELASAN